MADDTTLTVVQPIITAITPDTGTPGDFITSNHGFFSLRGTDRAFGTVEIFLDSGSGFVSQGTAGAGSGVGNWTFPFTLPDGTYTVQARDELHQRPQCHPVGHHRHRGPSGPGRGVDAGHGQFPHRQNYEGRDVNGDRETNATVEYSVNGGTTWTTNFTAVKSDTVDLRQTDVAGNSSPVTI